MSDARDGDDAPTPQSLRGTLVVLSVLALLASTAIALAGLYVQRGETSQLYEQVFGKDARLPYGFERTGGSAFGGDQRWIHLSRPSAAAEVPSSPDGSASNADTTPTEDAASSQGAASTKTAAGGGHRGLPKKVAIGRFSSRATARRPIEADEALTGDGFAERLTKWRENPRQGWSGVLERGVVEFARHEADFVHLRFFEAGGTFYDIIRVDISTGEHGQILSAEWPQGDTQASEQLLAPFLEQLQLAP